MNVLTDTLPTHHTPYTQWNTIQEHVSAPPFHHRDNTTVLPYVSVWQTSVKPLCATQHNRGFPVPMTPYASSFDTAAHLDSGAARSDSFASVASKPPMNSNLSLYYPFGVTNHRTREPAQAHWQEPPHRTDALHPASVAALVGKFERMLTFVIPSSRTHDPNHHCATPVHIPHDHPDDSFPFQGEATESFGKDGEQTHLHYTPPPSFAPGSTAPLDPSLFERDATEPLEHDIVDRIYSSDLADQPKPPPGAASPPTHTILDPLPSPRAVQLVHPRPPTPPSSRRPSNSTRRNTGATYHRTPTTETDLAALPVAQASVQAGKRSQLQHQLGASRSPRPAPHHAQSPDDDGLEVRGSWSGWGVPSRRKTALDRVLYLPSADQCRRRRRKVGVEVEVEEGQEELRYLEPRARIKQTRFVVPDPEDVVAIPPGRPHRTRPNDTRRTSGPGPLRSILRNKPAPYDKGMVRHAGRKASVP